MLFRSFESPIMRYLIAPYYTLQPLDHPWILGVRTFTTPMTI